MRAKSIKGGNVMEIGSKLKKARTEKGLTQEQSAEALGVSRQTISNWENNKSYPDIISVIKMSDIYSVSLDHLLKEEKSMNQTYMEYLEESTNTVKAKKNVEKIILFSTCFIVWAIAEVVFWIVKEPIISEWAIIFRWILIPLLTLLTTFIIAKKNYWGKANWFSTVITGIIFMTIPYTQYICGDETVTYVFKWPNFGYMAVGVVIALFGLGIGTLIGRKKD